MSPRGQSTYPVRVTAAPEPSATRGLWLIKWLLLIPHVLVLVLLWLGFAVLSVVALFSILITGHYPRSVFDYNVGVLRWTWRVQYYGYGALGTDRYPPFTLAERPDYPANLTVDYPQRLSRGLALVKWWLLAVPHYLVLAVFIGGGVWLDLQSHAASGWGYGWGAGGLVGLLVLLAAIALLFTGRYPRSLYDLVLGMDRWALRVAAYAALMTDRYPPFRLDIGGMEPGPSPDAAMPRPAGAPGSGEETNRRTPAWTGGRISSVVIGALLIVVSTGLLGGGGTLLWANQTQRVGSYVMDPTAKISTANYAIASGNVELLGAGFPWVVDHLIGTARLEATPAVSRASLFIGVARTSDVTRYLHGVAYREVTALGPPWSLGQATEHLGGPPSKAPGMADFWVAESSGPGVRSLTWRPSIGNWTVVVMRNSGQAGVDATVRLGASAPGLPWVAAGLLTVGAIFLIGGGLAVGLAVRRASRAVGSSSTPTGSTPQIKAA